jgi:hypothetical protein
MLLLNLSLGGAGGANERTDFDAAVTPILESDAVRVCATA